MRIASALAVVVVCACGGRDTSGSADASRIELELAKAHAAAAASPDGKVTICHIPPGNPANAHEIRVGEPAVRAHVERHGDTVGGCCVPVEGVCGTTDDCCSGLSCIEGHCVSEG
jgi:hypothetical protein